MLPISHLPDRAAPLLASPSAAFHHPSERLALHLVAAYRQAEYRAGHSAQRGRRAVATKL